MAKYKHKTTGNIIDQERYDRLYLFEQTQYVKVDSGDFATSAIIGAVTDSAILGGLIGGSVIGGILGDSIDGDLFD